MITVSGIEANVRTPLAYMVAPAGPDGGFVSGEEIHENLRDETWSSNRAAFIHE